MIFIRLTLESFRFAWQALRSNLLRTTLSLLGVTIGIFAIIAVSPSWIPGAGREKRHVVPGRKNDLRLQVALYFHAQHPVVEVLQPPPGELQ
jgi:hypothetical protein